MTAVHYMPEATNDRMIAFIGEPNEWLLVGAILVSAFVVWRVMRKKLK